jgi:phosphatidylserine/phosphatidylglycerophosphate/cardiolipin synthase-like enzyme
VFSLVLSLSLVTLSPVLPAASVTSGAAIPVCFSPEEDCAAFAVRAINNAEREILVGAYGLTTGSGIDEALIRAKGRGVDVRLIADKPRRARLQMVSNPWSLRAYRSGSTLRRGSRTAKRW